MRLRPEMAAEISPFPLAAGTVNRCCVIRNHGGRRTAPPQAEYEGSRFCRRRFSWALSACHVGQPRRAWDRALELGTAYGFRMRQVTVIAPTGTIRSGHGLRYHRDRASFALVKFKETGGRRLLKIINQSLPPACKLSGYTEAQIRDIGPLCGASSNLKGRALH